MNASHQTSRVSGLRRFLFPAVGAAAGAVVAAIVSASGFSAAGFLPALLMFLAVLALLVAVVSIWQSLRHAFGPADPLGARLGEASMERQTLEDEKAALLRSMADLKFEKQIGKIAEPDFERLDAGLRSRTREVMRILDDDVRPFRDKADTLIREHLDKVAPRHPYRSESVSSGLDGEKKRKKKRKPAPSADASVEGPEVRAQEPETAPDESLREAPSDDDAVPADIDARAEAVAPPPSEPVEAVVAAIVCAACETRNDTDATFCKKCGSRLSDEAGS
jgi:hypothetical protein